MILSYMTALQKLVISYIFTDFVLSVEESTRFCNQRSSLVVIYNDWSIRQNQPTIYFIYLLLILFEPTKQEELKWEFGQQINDKFTYIFLFKYKKIMNRRKNELILE